MWNPPPHPEGRGKPAITPQYFPIQEKNLVTIGLWRTTSGQFCWEECSLRIHFGGPERGMIFFLDSSCPEGKYLALLYPAPYCTCSSLVESILSS